MNSRGFTLIEVLIALAVLAIALAAAVRASSVAIDSANESKLRTLATWVAQNRLAETQAVSVAALPGLGEVTGRATMANVEFEWRQRISTTPNEGFRRVDVTVSRPGETFAYASLIGYVSRARLAADTGGRP
jgi:general secretion pathway protein I